jgi:signal peptidase I
VASDPVTGDPVSVAPDPGAPTTLARPDAPLSGPAPATVFHDLPPAMAGTAVQRDENPGVGRRRARWVVEWALVILVALGVAYGMRQYVVGTYFIPSASMEPTLMVGDRILVNKLAYHLHDIHRGDIVVFGRPPRELSSPEIKDLVKRVVGLPGEWISSAPGGQVLVGTTPGCRDQHPVPESYLTDSARSSPGPAIGCKHIPAGQYFVMGDNRGDSEDSRAFGPIPRSIVVGHVVMRFWPLGQIHVF